MYIARSGVLGTWLCKALGLNLNKAAKVNIVIGTDDMIFVRVDTAMTQDCRSVRVDGISDAAIDAIAEHWLQGDAQQDTEPVGLLSGSR